MRLHIERVHKKTALPMIKKRNKNETEGEGYSPPGYCFAFRVRQYFFEGDERVFYLRIFPHAFFFSHTSTTVYNRVCFLMLEVIVGFAKIGRMRRAKKISCPIFCFSAEPTRRKDDNTRVYLRGL